MNHRAIAAEALRYRLRMIDPAGADRFDVDAAAADALGCADPEIDRAIRSIGTTWLRAGLEPDAIAGPWPDDDVDRLVERRPELIDDLDTIVERVRLRELCP